MSDKELIKEEKKKLKQERKKVYVAAKEEQKKAKNELKESVKKQKLEIERLKKEYKTAADKINYFPILFKEGYKKTVSEFKARKELKHKESEHKELSPEELESLKIDFYKNRVNIKNNILQEKFEYGSKYKTFSWQCLKWTYGIKKEFNRIVWSNTTNTFKYLGIILLIIGLLALLFFGIDSLVDVFR